MSEARLLSPLETKYSIKFEINVGKLLPKYGNKIDDVNRMLGAFGINNQVKVISKAQFATMTVNRPLERKEVNKIKEVIKEHLNNSEFCRNIEMKLVSIRKI